MALTRRKMAPKSKPEPDSEPIETIVCPEVVMAEIKNKRVMCSECGRCEVWRKELCYEHYRNSKGLFYSPERNRFIEQ